MGRRINVVLVVVAVMIAMLVATPTASGAPAARAGACFGMAPTITGTAAGETINGTAGSDVIWAGGGNDTVFGLGGNDRICGAAGNDTVNGGPGNDKINGGGGADSLFGNDGDDQLKGGKGNDTLSGIPGFDVDQAGTGTDACDLVDDVFGSCESYFGTFDTAATTLDIGLAAGQTLTLPQGWSGADPRTFNITSGGSVSTSYLHTHPLYQSGDCTGFAIQAPDFEFTYTAGTPQPLLRFFWIPDTPGTGSGIGDAVLIINAPNGRWYCNDDSSGTLNPQIDFNTPSTGVYDVYVASYASGGGAPGVLRVTELNSHNVLTP